MVGTDKYLLIKEKLQELAELSQDYQNVSAQNGMEKNQIQLNII